MRRTLLRQNNNGPGEIELAGDRLHCVGLEALAIKDHRKRIARKAGP